MVNGEYVAHKADTRCRIKWSRGVQWGEPGCLAP
jgi:hypothetical protein